MYPKKSYPVVKAAGGVESHGAVESACACNGAVVNFMDPIQNLYHRVLFHTTAHVQLEVRLACDLPIAGGVGADSVGVHHPTVVKLLVEDRE